MPTDDEQTYYRQEYKVIKATVFNAIPSQIADIERQVNELMSQESETIEWEPLGGIVFGPDGIVYQSMIKTIFE